MTRKPLPLIGRIQERMATGAPSLPQDQTGTRSTEPDAGIRRQSDWIMERIRATASQFSSLAQHGGMAATTASASERGTRHERALLLGYKLTLTAWRRREPGPARDVLSAVRSRMIRELRSASADPAERVAQERTHVVTGGDEGDDALARKIRRTLLDPADSDIAASLIRFEAGLPGPLTPFYGDLAPAFGGPCASEALSTRYGKTVRLLYETIERKLDEVDRSANTGSGATRYAGTGY